jgi:hypothetical protein
VEGLTVLHELSVESGKCGSILASVLPQETEVTKLDHNLHALLAELLKGRPEELQVTVGVTDEPDS